MRPVDRGLAPRSYQQYEDAIEDLTAQLGKYCSYCERYISIGLAVEHVLPKSLHPELKTTWTNFLLGCTNCNSVKGAQDIEIGDSLWPDRDNTLLAIVYTKGGFVTLANGLNAAQQSKTQALLNLVGLQRHPTASGTKPARRDKRWQDRDNVWELAERCREDFEKLGQVDEARKLIIKVATSRGFFSVWMIVFDNYPDVKKELIKSFPGTATVCFNPNGKPLNRPGGSV
jgi:HNH endonuclease